MAQKVKIAFGVDSEGNVIDENGYLTCKNCGSKYFEKLDEENRFLEDWINYKWMCIQCGNIEDTCAFEPKYPPPPSIHW